MAAAGIAFAGWVLSAPPSKAFGAVLLLGMAGMCVGVWLFSGRSGAGPGRALAAGAAALLAGGACFWTYNVESGFVGALLRLRMGGLARMVEGWEAAVLSVGAGLGVLLGLVVVCEAVGTVVKSWKDRKGRKRARSELFGKAKFLERRWLRELAKGSGVLLGSSRDGLVAYPLEGSAMTFAPPRTGKGATIALNYLSPQERGWRGSTVVIDPRGELFPIVARRRRSLGRRPILLDPFGMVAKHRELEGGEADFGEDAALHLPVWNSDRYNPLDFIREGDEAVRDIGVLVEALMERPKSDGGNSKHFYESARSLISGYLSWVRFRMPPDRRNLKTLYELLSLGNEARDRLFAEVAATDPFCGGLMHLAMERSKRVGKEEGGFELHHGLEPALVPELSGGRGAYGLVELRSPRSGRWRHGRVRRGARRDDEPGEGLAQAVDLDPLRGGVQARDAADMLVVIDELPAIGHLQPVMDGYNLAAGKGVHFWTFAQSVSALDETWGSDSRKTLMHLAEVVQVLGWPRMDVEGAEILSKAIGAATFENRSESRSGQIRDTSLMPDGQGSVQESLSVVKEQLAPADEILSMGPDEQLVIASPKDMPRDVIRLRHARYWQLEGVRDLADPNPYVIRKERSLAAAA